MIIISYSKPLKCLLVLCFCILCQGRFLQIPTLSLTPYIRLLMLCWFHGTNPNICYMVSSRLLFSVLTHIVGTLILWDNHVKVLITLVFQRKAILYS